MSHSNDDVISVLRATTARALAKALITGIDQAEQEGNPLTQNQMVDMATMAIMSYDEAIEAGDAFMTFQDIIEKAEKGYPDTFA